MRFRSIALLAVLPVAGCTPTEPARPSVPAEETYAASLEVDIANMVKVDENLYYKDIIVGTGAPVVTYGKEISVYYAGYFRDGTVFDSNYGEEEPTTFVLNDGLIAGWYIGIPAPAGAGMRPGGVRKLVVGSRYGYGPQGKSATGRPSIPPHTTLVFDIRVTAAK